MPRNYFLINLIILTIIGLLGFRFYKAWARPLDIPTQVSQQQFQSDKKRIADKKELILDEAAYHVIVRKDLFRPSRSAPQVEDTSAVSFSKETPKLFGTVIINNERSAILENPSTKITKLYRINDSFAGFIVSDIQKDKVILKKGDKSIEVKLRAIKTIILPRQKSRSISSRRPHSLPTTRRSPAHRRARDVEKSPPSPHEKAKSNKEEDDEDEDEIKY